jgi:transcriptional regulator with XRE-family HTH domain
MADSESYFDPRLFSPEEVRRQIAGQARRLRIERSMKQSDLARASGVSQATISRFESSGLIGFDALVNLALALGAEQGLAQLFAVPPARSVDEIVTRSARAIVRRVR